MFGIHDYGVFLLAGIMLNLTPGQDTIYIAGRSMAEGVRVGIASALGVGAGSTIHVLAATLGLSALLATSALAFSVVKWAGAAYLAYLGLKLLLSRRRFDPAAIVQQRDSSGGSAFRRGILTNVLNPKVAVFFLAFLPQFVSPDSPRRAAAFLVLGGTFVVTGTLWCLVIAVVSARASGRIRRSATAATVMNRIAGGLFVGLGIKLAISRTR